ncbi:hypothetical protein [Ruegeria sp.]|uniref:hypothetical protein n=1 Tax=Ruegeria sp. TaxID=1879320 RepID=UPI003C7EA298
MTKMEESISRLQSRIEKLEQWSRLVEMGMEVAIKQMLGDDMNPYVRETVFEVLECEELNPEIREELRKTLSGLGFDFPKKEKFHA